MNRKLRSIAFDDTRTQAADLLLELCRNFGMDAEDGCRIGIRLSQRTLADMVGITRESMSKILSEFKKDGIITIEDRYIHVRDRARLEMYGEGA